MDEPVTARGVMEHSTLSVTIEGPIAQLRLTRPELLNRFDEALHEELPNALGMLARRTDVRAIVIASNGPVFSAGGDFDFIRACNGDLATAVKSVEDGRRLLMTILDVPQPIIAAVQGDAIGLGATVVMACDSVVMAQSARLGDPHVAIGLVAGDGGCLFWPQSVGMMRAKRYLLTGELMSAAEAHAAGAVTDVVVEAGDVVPRALQLAMTMAKLPPLAVQGTKRALNEVLRHRAAEVVALAFAHEVTTLRSDDVLEAIAAFAERRTGDYSGR